jgi:hypothetical protein
MNYQTEQLGRMLDGAGWLLMSEEQRRVFRRASRVLNMADKLEMKEVYDDGI